MPESGTSGSVGTAGEQSPAVTRPKQQRQGCKLGNRFGDTRYQLIDFFADFGMLARQPSHVGLVLLRC